MSPTAGPAIDPTGFRRLMARWATGVSVVAAHDPAGDAGLTVNALFSVSLRPPSVLAVRQVPDEAQELAQHLLEVGDRGEGGAVAERQFKGHPNGGRETRRDK